MRSLLLGSVALTATLTSAFSPSVADACGGGYGGPVDRTPAVFAVDAHNVLVEGAETWQRRAFVLLGAGSGSTDLTWKQLAPGTFDGTRIADLPDPAHLTTFTLVGPSGSRVVSTNRLSMLGQTFRNRNEQTALEIGLDAQAQFSIAVLGTQPDAKWITVTDSKPGNAAAWLVNHGVKATHVYTSKVEGTALEVVSAKQADREEVTSYIRLGNRSLGQYTGHAIGALSVGGRRYVLFETNGLITPAAV